MNERRLRETIQRHEGLRLTTYQCPAGKWTIGYGRNLEDTGISIDEANVLLANDLRRVRQQVESALPWFDRLSALRQEVLLNMAFQLGIAGLLRFRRALEAMHVGNWELARHEMLDSRWAKQTPERALELAEAMCNNQFPER